VAVIQDTLRRGVDCHVKLTNYRKNGDLFENLLTMRPVHDSNGVYRFCIGVQFEITEDTALTSRLSKLNKLVSLLPATLEVGSQGVYVHGCEVDSVQIDGMQRKECDMRGVKCTESPFHSTFRSPPFFPPHHHRWPVDRPESFSQWRRRRRRRRLTWRGS
jgi:hypothetical protein